MKHFRKIRKLAVTLLAAAMLIALAPAALAESFSAFVSSGSMPVYTTRALSKKAATLDKWTVVVVEEYSGGVAKIRYGGKTYYARSSYMTAVEDYAEKAVATKDSKVYKTASTSSASIRLPKGYVVNVIQSGSKWSLVENGHGVAGYCYTSVLDMNPQPAATPKPTQAPGNNPVTVYITEDCKVYKAASTSSKAYSVKEGMEVLLYGVEGSWALIQNPGNGMYAYCSPAYLSVDKPGEGEGSGSGGEENSDVMIINADTKVYKKASTSSASVAVKKGMEVTVLEKGSTWTYIENPSNGVRAYIKTSYLSQPAGEPTPTPTPDISNAVPAKITKRTMVYSQPTVSVDLELGYMDAGVIVNLVKTSGDWALIERNGSFGYVKTADLTTNLNDPTPTPSPKPTQNAYTKYINANTNVYEKASTSSKATSVKMGLAVTVIDVDGSWAYIMNPSNGAYAYIQTKYLSDIEDLPTPDPFADWTYETFDATIVTTSAKFYAEASDSSSAKNVAQGKTVTVTCFDDTWAYVSLDGSKGFMLRSDLSRKQYAELKLGTTASAVSTLEKTLLGLGYFDVVPNDTFDSYTEAAVKRLQAVIGFNANGVASQDFQRVLYSGNIPECSILSKSYSKGAQNDDVKRIQQRLYALDYYAKSSSVDGQYGSNTATAISNFQKANGLNQTGTADSATIRKLYSTSAVANSGGGADEGGGGTVVQPDPGNQQNGVAWISDSLASKTSKLPSNATNAEKLEYVIYLAQNQLGKKYVWGTEGPNTYDCTGLTYMAFKGIGITLPRTAVSQGTNSKYTRIYDISALRRGDIVYFNTVSDNDLSDHAGIYLGAGWFIHASSGGAKVQINTLNSGYYNRVFSWGHHILP